jgi:hypothetical protein
VYRPKSLHGGPAFAAREFFGQYRQRLEQNPNDHATRLALARALRTSHELEASLDQYEALIEVAQLLPDIGTDLSESGKRHETSRDSPVVG